MKESIIIGNMTRITLFSSSTCMPCKTLKQYLSMKQIEYVERSIDNEPNLRDEIINLVGYSIFPTLTVETDGKMEFVAGLNIGKVRSLLNV